MFRLGPLMFMFFGGRLRIYLHLTKWVRFRIY